MAPFLQVQVLRALHNHGLLINHDSQTTLHWSQETPTLRPLMDHCIDL
ncbi:unnamed protein product [Brassica oleracea var. botrytis]